MESGIGDHDRLQYILNTVSEGKYLYLSDKNYLENLLHSIPVQKESLGLRSDDNDVVNELLDELRLLNKKVEQIERTGKIHTEEKGQSKSTESYQNITQKKPNEDIPKKKVTPKNEDLTLALSIILGLVGLAGISQIYLNKVAKGIGIMIISFMLIGFIIYFISPQMPETEFDIPIAKSSFLIVASVGFLGLYVYQVFDARKLCLTYNKYVTEHKTPPPWW